MISDQEEVMLRLRHELFHDGSRVMEYLSVLPAKASEFSFSAARSDGSLEALRVSILSSCHTRVIRTILQDTMGNLCPPDCVIITESDWKDVVNLKSCTSTCGKNVKNHI